MSRSRRWRAALSSSSVALSRGLYSRVSVWRTSNGLVREGAGRGRRRHRHWRMGRESRSGVGGGVGVAVGMGVCVGVAVPVGSGVAVAVAVGAMVGGTGVGAFDVVSPQASRTAIAHANANSSRRASGRAISRLSFLSVISFPDSTILQRCRARFGWRGFHPHPPLRGYFPHQGGRDFRKAPTDLGQLPFCRRASAAPTSLRPPSLASARGLAARGRLWRL